MMMDKQDFLFVYDKKLRNRIIDSGEKYITTAHAVSSLKRFWLFYKSENVVSIADEYLEEKETENVAI